MTKTKIILATDKKSARYVKNIEGWVSRLGHFYGTDERLARLDGCTHTACEDCGTPTDKNRYRVHCDDCRHKRSEDNYFAKEEIKWGGKVPLYSVACDEYLWDEDDILNLMEDTETEDLRLVVCEQEDPVILEADFWEDCMPEDYEVPDSIQSLIDALNFEVQEKLEKTWFPSEYRTTY